MTKLNVSLGLALVAILIAIGAWFHGESTAVSNVGGVGTSCGGSISCLLGDMLVSGSLYLGGTNPANSVEMTAVHQSLVSGTSTPCSIQNPYNATSTVTDFALNITTATSSAIQWVVGTSTTAFATSSSMLTQSVAANAQATIAYGDAFGSNVVGPSQYVLAGPGAGTSVGTNAFSSILIVGTCQASFKTVN